MAYFEVSAASHEGLDELGHAIRQRLAAAREAEAAATGATTEVTTDQQRLPELKAEPEAPPDDPA